MESAPVPIPFWIPFSTAATFEGATRGISPAAGLRAGLRFKFTGGSCSLEEGAKLYRMVEEWDVDGASRELFRRAAKTYDLLDALETCLELAEGKLKESAPISQDCFDALRAAANAVCLSARDDSTALRLLDAVVIDAQRLGRLCRALNFGPDDVQATKLAVQLAEDDFTWLLSDGAGVRALTDEGLLAGGDGGSDDGLLAGGDGDGLLGFLALALADPLAGGDGGDGLLAGGDGDSEGLLGFLALVLADDDALLAGGDGDVLVADAAEALAVAGKTGDAVPEKRGAWIHVKEQTVVSLLGLRIRRLVEAIATAKRLPVRK